MCSTVFNPFKFRWLKGYIYISCYYHHQIGSINLIIFCHLLHVHSGKTGILFSLSLCSLWWVLMIGYVLACRSYSFICTLHYLIITILLVIHYTIYGAVWFQFSHFLVIIEKIYTLSYYHRQIGSMNYYMLFRARSWNSGMRCMSLYSYG